MVCKKSRQKLGSKYQSYSSTDWHTDHPFEICVLDDPRVDPLPGKKVTGLITTLERRILDAPSVSRISILYQWSGFLCFQGLKCETLDLISWSRCSYHSGRTLLNNHTFLMLFLLLLTLYQEERNPLWCFFRISDLNGFAILDGLYSITLNNRFDDNVVVKGPSNFH